MRKNTNLEIIRGFAAILVFLNHIIGKIEIPIFRKTLIFNLIGNWGTEAVIIFFVLSGIVIGLSLEEKVTSTSKFLKNRFLRIFPQYIIGLILAIVAEIIIKHSFPDSKNTFGSLFFLSSLQNWITSPLEYNPVIWSLTFEMFFYIFFSFTIGKHHQKLIFSWFVFSLTCIPFYYMSNIHNGLLKHFIAMFSFSSIWLVGYFINKYIL